MSKYRLFPAPLNVGAVVLPAPPLSAIAIFPTVPCSVPYVVSPGAIEAPVSATVLLK